MTLPSNYKELNQDTDRGIWFEIQIWKETTTYDSQYIIDSLPIYYNQKKIKDYFFILHDKDNEEHKHYHIVICFNNQIWKHQIKKWFKIPLEHQVHIEKIKDRNAFFRYMIHRTTESSNKYQYEPGEVFASNQEIYDNAFASVVIDYESDEVYQMLEEIEDFLGSHITTLSYYDFTKWLRNRGQAYYNLYLNRKYYFHLNQLWKDCGNNRKIIKGGK